MPFEMNLNQLPQVTAPACIHLRSKSMYVHGTLGQTEHPSHGAVEVFQENLRRCLDGQPLLNLVDWQRGY